MMASALRDLLPVVEGGAKAKAPFPSIDTVKGKLKEQVAPQPTRQEDHVVFGGLDLLFPKPSASDPVVEKKDEETLLNEAWSNGLKEAEALFLEQQKKDEERLKAEFEQEKEDLANLLHISLTGHIQQQFDEIRDALADQLAEILEPFLAEEGRKAMVRQFSEVASIALEESIAETPILKGPKDLLQQLSACSHYLDLNALVEDELSEGKFAQQDELSLRLDKTVYETRLKAYLAQLREAVQDV